jgi:ABC-type multidrug transport system fused ATPase/permease subunit
MAAAVQAFTSLSLFTVLRMPLFQLPQLISQVINARVALNRIQAFLAADEQPDLPIQPPVPAGQHGSLAQCRLCQGQQPLLMRDSCGSLETRACAEAHKGICMWFCRRESDMHLYLQASQPSW